MLHLAAQNEDFQPSEFLTLGVEVEVRDNLESQRLFLKAI